MKLSCRLKQATTFIYFTAYQRLSRDECRMYTILQKDKSGRIVFQLDGKDNIVIHILYGSHTSRIDKIAIKKVNLIK